MKPILMSYLLCPECGSKLECNPHEQKEVALTAEETSILDARKINKNAYRSEILSGRLNCSGCGSAFPIWEGVPRIYKDAEKDFPLPEENVLSTGIVSNIKDDRHVQKTFSREWEEYDYEDQTIWHWTLEDRLATFCEELGIRQPEELKGKFMLDAGCGPAILAMNLAQRYGVEIIAMDLSFVLSRAFARNRSNLCHFIQASVLAPPLRPAIFDITHSHGVLHHTTSTRDAFYAIEKLTRPGGLLYVWLYGKKQGWNRVKYAVIRTIRGITSRLPRYPQMAVIYLLTGFHMAIRSIKKLFGLKVAPIDSMNQLLVVTRDRYTPMYAREHTEAEVKGWFADAGYISVTRRTRWDSIDTWNGSTDLSIKGVKGGSARNKGAPP